MKIGFEVEYSDCLTIKTAKELYELWERDFSTFEDRYGGYNKPKLNYSQWNCMSDGSLRNSNGTRCMWSYYDPYTDQIKAASSSKKSGDREFWQGIEVLSPSFEEEELDEVLEDFSRVTDIIKENGGVASRSLYNALHIHVDVSDMKWRDVAYFVNVVYLIQDLMKKLSSDWPNSRSLTQNELRKLNNISLDDTAEKDQWYHEYQVIETKSGGWRKRGRDADGVRRLVDVGPYFNSRKSYDTIEFRCFASTLFPELVRLQIQLATGIVKEYKETGRVDYDSVREAVEEVLAKREELENA